VVTTLVLLRATLLATVDEASNRVLPPIVQADPGNPRLLASLSAAAPTVGVDRTGVVGGVDLRAVVVIARRLGQLQTRCRIREGGHGNLQDLGLELVPTPEPINKLQGEVLVVDRAPNGGQIVGDRLQPAGVGRDGHVPAGRGAKGFAEEEIPGGLVVEKEAMEPSPGGARQAVGGLHEAVQVITESCHELEADVNVDRPPSIIGITRSRALGDMIEDLVHGEKKLEDLAPLREIGAGGIDLELDVIVDVNVENWVGVGCGSSLGWEDESRRGGCGWDDWEISGKAVEVERSWRSTWHV
jgi:hypothetical protein